MEKGRLLQNGKVNRAIQVSKITLFINLSLSLLKFTAGYIGKSSAMLSDAVHSASDVLSTIVVMVGIKISEKQPDCRIYRKVKCHAVGRCTLGF